MRAAKYLAGIAAGLVVLLAGLLLGSLLVNPNRFKPRIIAAVKSATHRDLQLQGDIKLSVFPWIALQLGPATLGSPAGFQNVPFLSINRADIRVKLFPLLRKELEIDRVVLDGVDLNLVKNADGRGNWQMGSDEPATPSAPKTAGNGGTSLQSIAGVKITHGHLRYPPYELQNVDLETGAIAPDQDVPVTLSLDANRGIAGETYSLVAKLKLRNDPSYQDIQMGALDVSGTLTRSGQPQPVRYELSMPTLDANLDRQTVRVVSFSATIADAKLTGQLAGTRIIDDPSLSGSITLSSLALREFAPQVGIELPKTRDAKALSSLSLRTKFSHDADKTVLDDIEIKLDDTTLKGNVTLLGGQSQSLAFKLAADRIDLDRYRSAEGTIPDPKSAAADRPAAKNADGSAPLNASGVFTLASIHAAGVDLTNLSVTVAMADNITHLHPLVAQIYGGHYGGDLTYDARTVTPTLSMDEHLSGVDIAPLVADSHLKGRLAGKATINIKATARGDEADAIEKTLNGHFDASLSGGAITGIDVGYELALAQSLINKQSGLSVQNSGKTSFDAFKVSAQIVNGIAQTHDLTISSAVLKVGGQGTINLPTSGIDMTLLASVMKSATTTAVDIPLKISGTYTDPTVRPDVEAAAKGEIKQKVNDVLKKNGLDLDRLFKH